MNENNQINTSQVSEEVLNKLILTGDISSFNDNQKKEYVLALCRRYSLDPVTKPFSIIAFQGKQQVYANKSTTDQIREIKNLSVKITDTKQVQDIYIVTAEVNDGKRTESSTGAVTIKGLNSDSLANALMKAETKAKRRATLSFMGLSVMDDTEIETIPNAKHLDIEIEVKDAENKDSSPNIDLDQIVTSIHFITNAEEYKIKYKEFGAYLDQEKVKAAFLDVKNELIAQKKEKEDLNNINVIEDALDVESEETQIDFIDRVNKSKNLMDLDIVINSNLILSKKSIPSKAINHRRTELEKGGIK